MPERNNPPKARNANSDSPLFTLLRQYLTTLTGRDPVVEVHKSRQARTGRKQAGVFVKNMRVDMKKKSPAPREKIREDALVPELERSLQQYISRRQAALSRYATKAKPSTVAPDFLAHLPKTQESKDGGQDADARNQTEASVSAQAPGSWKRLVQLLPFMSAAVVDTAARTEKMEKTLQKTEVQTQKMAERLKQAEALLDEKIKPMKVKQEKTARALSKAENERLQASLGRIRSAEQELKDIPREVITKDDMGGLKKVKDAGTFGIAEKKKPGFFASWFGGLRDAAAEIQETGAHTPKKGARAAAPVAGKAPDVTPRGGSLLRTAAPEAAPVDVAPEKTAVSSVDKDAPSVLTDLVSSFSKETAPRTAPAAAPAASATLVKTAEERKKDQDTQKQKLAAEEKRAEMAIMTAKPRQQKEAGFFTQLIAATQYMGMGKERLAIVQNLATMLNAGLPLIDALKTLQMETKNRATKKLLARINAAVDNGSPLWRAMDSLHFFSPHAIALIRIGEEAGNLAQNMEYLAAQQEKDQGLREKVKMAMIYPIIVMVLMFIVVMGLGLFVLPQLVQVLFNLNVDLPLVTRIVIAFSNSFSQNGHIVVPGILGGALLLAILGKFTRFKVVIQWITFRIPGIGKLARQATLARFGVILGGLLEAGVPLVEAMRSLVEVTPIVSYKRFYRRLLEHITVGDSFAKCFASIPNSNALFPVSMQQLIITGERTGSLSKIMLKLSEIYEKEANNTAQKLPVILEPMLLLFIGALVGTIAFAIIIPIYSVVGNVNK